MSSEHGVSKVCGDNFDAFEDVWSERLVLHVVCVECTVKAKAKVAVQTKKRLAFFSLEQDHKQRREG